MKINTFEIKTTLNFWRKIKIPNIDASFKNPSSNLKLVKSFCVELVYPNLTVELSNSIRMRGNKTQAKPWI